MTKRTRYFLTGSVAILLVGLGTGLVAYYKGDLPMFRSRVGPDELAYVPADAAGVAYANVQDIMNSQFRQKLRERMPGIGQGKDEFFNQTGIDVERDIRSVLATSSGVGDPANTGLLLIRGSFDEGRIEALIREHGGAVTDYKGRRLMIMPVRNGQAPEDGACLTFPESGLAMLGGVATVHHAIDTRDGGANVTSNEQMMKLIADLDGVGNTAWAVGGIDALAKNPKVPEQVREQLPGVEWVSVSARVDGGVSGELRAEAKDDKAAADLRAVVNGAVAAGHLMSGRNPKFDAFLNTLQVQGVGRTVELGFNVPSDMVDMIGAASGSRRLPPPAIESGK
jgi:hypothetical protein